MQEVYYTLKLSRSNRNGVRCSELSLMITYESLVARPSAFTSLSGLTLADFEALYQEFAAAYAQDRQQSLTRAGKPRRRAAGGGTPFTHDGRTRLLMALVFLRVCPLEFIVAVCP